MQRQGCHPTLGSLQVWQHHVVCGAEVHGHILVIDELVVHDDPVVKVQPIEALGVGAPGSIALSGNHKGVAFRKLSHGVEKHMQALVRTNQPKKQVHMLALMNAELPFGFFGPKALRVVVVQGMKQSSRPPLGKCFADGLTQRDNLIHRVEKAPCERPVHDVAVVRGRVVHQGHDMRSPVLPS